MHGVQQLKDACEFFLMENKIFIFDDEATDG